MDIRTERPTQLVELTDAELDKVVGGDNPHGLNPGGQHEGCNGNPNCTNDTGNPHLNGSTGNPH